MANDFLHPLSYHLRNFGQYLKLDLAASDMGNITFTGANMVGKTTLANNWFPMLIDGSIASSSFTAARNSDAVNQSTNHRDSTRDKRTFNSAFLGWGDTAFKVRTGYSYVTLGSSKRTVVLGIGAHRQSDGFKSKTWWFVLESDKAANLICADDAGNSLELPDFMKANAVFGDQLHVFKDWKDYRGFVAINLYGFDSGDTLGKLANAYHLLASPILSGGSVRFAPIPNALREAQEPIDREQIIRPLAESQHQLSQSLALQQHLNDGQKRLKRIRTELFWGNFNLLANNQLPEHTRLVTARDDAQNEVTQALAAVARCNDTLKLLHENRDSANMTLRELQSKLSNQSSLEQKRNALDREITLWHDKQVTYERQQVDLKKYRATAATFQAQLVAIQQEATKLRDEAWQPLSAQLYTHSAVLTELGHAIAETQQDQMLAGLADYIKTKQGQIKSYRNFTATIAQTSKDVALVQGMQGQMGTAIDENSGGVLTKGANHNLHAANKDIHESGAAEMNKAVAALQKKQQALLDEFPDLQTLLDEPQRLATLNELFAQLTQVAKQMQTNAANQERTKFKLESSQQQIKQLLSTIDTTFDPAVAQKQVEELTIQRNALQIDPSLKQKVQEQQAEADQLQQSISKLMNDRGVAQGTATAKQERVDQARTELVKIDANLNAARKVLIKYVPVDVELNNIQSLITFEHANRATIKQHSYKDLGTKIRALVDGRETEKSLDTLFRERGEMDMASALRENRTVEDAGLTTVPFELDKAAAMVDESIQALAKAVNERKSGQSVALNTYLNAAVMSISQQYAVIPEYNEMLTAGVDADGIRLHIALQPLKGSTEAAVAEARDLQAESRPELTAFVQDQIAHLVDDPNLADDDEAFIERANKLLDTRYWSEFVVTIKRRHSDVAEVVNDAFVQSGGSGAEKAQAMVLPLLLVPKMRLQRAGKSDALRLTMFDEFADKLDPETAKVFAQTINRFGFNFIATMPSGSQNKILADGVANRAYEILSPNHNDGKFHVNQVQEVLTWRAGDAHD